ncbi:MAG: SpoIID/LytB domain-containing protein [Bacteroidales bacterium]|nr:SpoIID/LytB domain-containing protein [Bacteroidales bacterium]
MKRLITILILIFLTLSANAERVRVRLFSNNKIDNLTLSFDLGSYNLYGDHTTLLESEVSEGRTVELRAKGQQVSVVVGGDDYGTFNAVRLEATDTACIVCINPRNLKNRTYEGNIEVSVMKNGALLIINDVEFETYIAGVVQSEIYGSQSDIFRIQAIISRTWALRNKNKHHADGYNFCDYVHCQAYNNRCVRPDIMLGTIQSSGETLVDANGELIETPFHSNSGGQTANSEDVWRTALPYLRSVDDTFSFRMRQSDWTKTISIERWLAYFEKTHHINTSDSVNRDELLHFAQPQRKAKILNIPLTKIRSDWQLKSTFFSVDVDTVSRSVILHGHGYGHGVGLSQEGTIRMVGLGIDYDSILRHYYTGAIIHHDDNVQHNYVENYVQQISKIIEEDKAKQTQVKSKKDDWLGRLFRLRDREEREEVYDEANEDNERTWEYDW